MKGFVGIHLLTYTCKKSLLDSKKNKISEREKDFYRRFLFNLDVSHLFFTFLFFVHVHLLIHRSSVREHRILKL